MLDEFWKEIGEIENSFGYSRNINIGKSIKNNVSNYKPDYGKYYSNNLTNIIGKDQNINQEKINFKMMNRKDSSQNQFQNDHTLKTLNIEPHLNTENLVTSKCHIWDSPSSISKWQSIGDLRPSTENGILTKSVKQITHLMDKNTQTEKFNNHFEKSKNQ